MIPELRKLRDKSLYSPMSSIIKSHKVIFDIVVDGDTIPMHKKIQRIRGVFQHRDFILVEEGWFHLLENHKGFIYIIIPSKYFMRCCKYFKEEVPFYYTWGFDRGFRYVINNDGNITGYNDYDDAVLSLMYGGQLYDTCDYSFFKSVGYDIRDVSY